MSAAETDPPAALRHVRIAGFVEATTYLALLTALAVRIAGGPRLSGVTGPVHGIAFLAYVAVVLIARAEQRWRIWPTVGALGDAVVPFGGYVVGHRLLRSAGPARG